MSDVIANTAGCAGAQGVPDQLLSILPKGTPPELIAAIEDATRKAFNSHGLSAFEMSRDAALAHEVGHTIVATAEGLVIRCTHLLPLYAVWKRLGRLVR